MDEIELLRLEEALEHRWKPSVAAIARGATEDEPHPFCEDRIQATHPVRDVHTPLEQAIERMSILTGPRPGKDGGLESLVEGAHHRQRAQGTAGVRGQRHAGQQSENAAAGRAGSCVHSVPPRGTVRMLSGEHTSGALGRPSVDRGAAARRPGA